jgi:hypothetical protein
MHLIPHQQRLYIRAHPVVFWMCIGLSILGFVGVVAPELLVMSAASQVLPDWLRTAFYISYTIGATMSVVAQLRGIARLEAAGMMLLASGFLAQFASAAYLLHTSAVSGLFLLTLAIGAFQRSRFLTEYGYPVRVVNGDSARRS